MWLSLSRVDYVQVGPTSPKSMCLLPITVKDQTNHIVVGDHSGNLSIFEVYDRIPQLISKTHLDTRITGVGLGAPEGHVPNRIFYTAGTGIRGLTRKGTPFLCFNTNLCEDIRSMCVAGIDLFVCGKYTLLHYSDLRDEKFTTLSERIHDIICLSPGIITKEQQRKDGVDVRRCCVIACDDRTIRVLRDETVVVSVETVGTPQVLKSFDADCSSKGGSSRDQKVLYGTVDGRLGLVSLDEGATPCSQRHLWAETNDKRAGAVTSLDLFDVTGDGVQELIVGRDDGLVEIHAFPEDGRPPEKRFSSRLGESVTSVSGGFVARPKMAEIVCCTFAGWVCALTTEPLYLVRSLGETPDPLVHDMVQKKLEGLKAEMSEIRTRVELEKKKPREPFYQTKESVVPLDVKHSFRLDPMDASYLLTIEVPTSIEYVLLQSDVSLELAKSDSSPSTIVSFTKSSVNPFLATFRCVLDDTTRLDIRLRTTEGVNSTLRAYVCPRRVYPVRTRLLQYEVKPLSLHQRTTTFDDKRPLNCLQLTGNFSLAEVHSWLSFCLPGLPERTPPADDDKVSYSFVSTLLGTVVECTCARGQGSIRSDNLTTIITLSDAMTREATKRKICVNIRCTIDDTSIAHTLRLIHHTLSHQLDLAGEVQVVEALLDVTAGDDDPMHASCLTPSYQALLRDADRLIAEHQTKSPIVGRLCEAIARLFVDCCRFRGRNFNPRLSALKAMLCSGSFSLKDIEEFFTNDGVDSSTAESHVN